MSRGFAGFMLVLSIVMLSLAYSAASSPKPLVVALWVIVGASSLYYLFFKKSKKKSSP